MFMNKKTSRGSRNLRRFALLCLSVLLAWGGWSFIASVRFIMKAMGVALGTALSMFFENIEFFFTAFFSGKSFVIGLLFGIVMYFHFRNRDAAESAAEEAAEKAENAAPAEEEIIETDHYMFH